MKTPLRLSVHPARFFSLSPGRRLALLSLLCLLLLTGGLDAASFERLPEHNLYTIGALAEAINVLTLLFMFWVVQCAQISNRTYLFLCAGLGSWLVSGTIDLVDEAYFQPWWLSTVEDSLRTLGMLATAWGVLLMVQQMYGVQTRLASLAMSDELTGLSNRRAFRAVLEAHVDQGTPLLLLDLDHFKQINDRFGHQTGDKVLCRVCECVSAQLRGEDLFVRSGGEEFLILLPQIDEGILLKVAERIRAAVAAMAPDPAPVTVSLGTTLIRPGEELSAVLARADEWLYRAKRGGRNQVAHDGDP